MPFRIAIAAAALSALLACGSSTSSPTSSAGGTGGGAGAGGGSGGGEAVGGGAGGGAAGSGGGLAGGAGGGSGAVDRPEYASGTRLRARVITTSDGAKSLLGWQDKQLGIACEFLPTTEGALRCLPDLSGLPQSISAYYGDSHCTQKVGLLTNLAVCGAPAYDYEYAIGACVPEYGTGAYRIFHVTGQYTGQLYYLSGATCSVSASSSPSYTYWSVGSEVDYTQFVAGSIATE